MVVVYMLLIVEVIRKNPKCLMQTMLVYDTYI